MKKNLLAVFATIIVLACTMVSVAQQERQTSGKYLISAEAGSVNFVQGSVAVTRNVGRSGILLKGDNVKIGDRVSTDRESKAEVLLNPGSYIRIGSNSSFEFVDTSLDNLQIRLTRGSAMFEVITTDGFTFAVNTPKAVFNVVKSGVYRVDVLADGNGKIEVWKGKAQIGDDEDAEVKKGKVATTGGDEVAVVKFDRGERDELEEWSKQRAKELAKANDRLEQRYLRNTLITGFNSRSWNMYDSFGLWIYDPMWSSFCFLPFGYGWSSPYGYGFGRDIWSYRLPYYIFNQPPPRNYPKDTRQIDTRGTANTNTTVKIDTPPTTRTPITPPFQRVDMGNGRGRVSTENQETRFPSGFPSRTFPQRTTPTSTSPSTPSTQSDTVPASPIKGKP